MMILLRAILADAGAKKKLNGSRLPKHFALLRLGKTPARCRRYECIPAGQ
jgi:hypothetical protein